MAVTATLVGGDLVIEYNAAGDLLADISSNGTKYTVTGTGLASKEFDVADVTGSITVRDLAAQAGQTFKVLAGTALANPLQVDASIETTSVLGGIVATKAGDVIIGSAAISLANNISTSATNGGISLAGNVDLTANTTLTAGSGAIGFGGTVNGGFSLTANSTGATTFGGTVGGGTPLASLTTNAGGSVSLRSVTTTGGQTHNDAVTLNANAVFASNNGAMTFASTLDGAKLATFAAGTGAVSFKGAVGSTQALAGITLTSAGSTTADSSIKLAKSADSGADGLTVAAGVNNVKMTAAGSSISGFAGNGVAFLGGSTNSQLGGFTVSGNGGNGMSFAAGSYLGTAIASNTITNNGDAVAFTGNGILVQGSDLTIGWDAKPASPTGQNVISNNGLNGIEITGSGAVGNTILSNSIFLNGQGLTQVVGGNTLLVGEGIALTAGGNGAQVAPTIYDVVRDSKNGKVHVQLTVPASGSYLVQLFANNATDEQGIFPVDVNGFQGRKFVGASPSGSPAPVGTGKPIISGTPVAGNTLVAIEVDASLVAAGDWITATATLLDGTTPTNTSGFSAGVQALAGQNFAVGADAPVAWTSDLPYVRVNQNEIRVFTPNVRTAVALHSYRNAELVLAPSGGAAGTTVVRTVTSVTCVGRNVVRLRLKPGASLPAGGGSMFLAPVSLPAARLYDAGNGTVMLDVTPARMVAALTDPTMVGIGGKGAATPAQARAFVSRFQGGIRVASADVNGDGFVDIVTAPGGGAGMPGGVFGDTPRIITIYNGNPNGTWQSSSINVSGEAGLASYTGGFQVSLANLRAENSGSGNAVAELVVASANNVFVYEISAAARGAKPIIDPVAKSVITTVGSVTGLAAGTFTDTVLADIIVATTTAGPAQVSQWLASADASQSLNRPASVYVYSAAANFAQTSKFDLGANLSNGKRLQNVFIGGASLAVGDVDNAPDQKPELILGAGFMGMGNFRVLANDVVAVGNQATVDAVLAGRLNVPSRAPTTTVNGKQVWQPTGGPDYFTGMASVPNAVALGANAPVTMAVVDSNGNGRAEIFAALGATNSTGNVVRRLEWNGVNAWDGASTLAGAGSIAMLPAPGSAKSRFPLGRGLRLG